MKYQKFIESVVSHVTESVSTDKKVTIQSVLKNNGTKYDGLVIIDPILNISPTIYLNPYYHRYLNGVPIEDIYDDILDTYQTYLPQSDFDISQFVDFENAKNHIIYKLVNKEKNLELLEDIPYVDFQDLVLIFLVQISDLSETYGTILIHNSHLNLWNIDKDHLFKIAEKNTPSLLPYYFDNFLEILGMPEEYNFDIFSKPYLYILTNSLKIHGATCMAYPGLLKELAETLNDNLIIIPSSIHEVLILPESSLNEDYSIDDLCETIMEVNEMELHNDEVLADHPYLYQKNANLLSY